MHLPLKPPAHSVLHTPIEFVCKWVSWVCSTSIRVPFNCSGQKAAISGSPYAPYEWSYCWTRRLSSLYRYLWEIKLQGCLRKNSTPVTADVSVKPPFLIYCLCVSAVLFSNLLLRHLFLLLKKLHIRKPKLFLYLASRAAQISLLNFSYPPALVRLERLSQGTKKPQGTDAGPDSPSHAGEWREGRSRSLWQTGALKKKKQTQNS